MRRTLVLFLGLILTVGAIGCKKEETKKDSEKTTTETTKETTTEDPAKP